MSLSVPAGLVCQVHSNVAGVSYNMVQQVCGHNQIENEGLADASVEEQSAGRPQPL